MFDGLDTTTQGLFIAPVDLVRWADRVRPHLEKMAVGSNGRYETQDLIAGLAAGRMLMWVAVEGAELLCVVLGQIMEYPRAKALRLTGIVGHHPRKWRHFLPAIERAARDDFGCMIVESLHQPGHARLLPGYRTTHCLSEKRL